jgi:multicomponent Na+:H+ antiporter subunit C
MEAGYLILVLLLVGIWGLIRKRNLIKKVIALSIINSAIVMLFLYGGASGNNAPILVGDITDIVDPVPQALMLTAIVVGICLTALALVLVYQMYQRYHTLDITKIEAQIEQEYE